jgi:hypothetical protein
MNFRFLLKTPTVCWLPNGLASLKLISLTVEKDLCLYAIWAGHVALMEELRRPHTRLFRKPEAKKPFGKSYYLGGDTSLLRISWNPSCCDRSVGCGATFRCILYAEVRKRFVPA